MSYIFSACRLMLMFSGEALSKTNTPQGLPEDVSTWKPQIDLHTFCPRALFFATHFFSHFFVTYVALAYCSRFWSLSSAIRSGRSCTDKTISDEKTWPHIPSEVAPPASLT